MTKYGLRVEKFFRSEKHFDVISLSSSISLSNIENMNTVLLLIHSLYYFNLQCKFNATDHRTDKFLAFDWCRLNISILG